MRDIPDYHMRRLVKPGLTGRAQINSSATDCEADTREKLCYDLYYIKNISFALDISILLKTVRRVLLVTTLCASGAAQPTPRPPALRRPPRVPRRPALIHPPRWRNKNRESRIENRAAGRGK